MKAFLLSFFVLLNSYLHNDDFINTDWISKVSAKDTDSFVFKENNYVIHYCFLKERTSRGFYTVSKDTLIIKERDYLHLQKPAYYRIKFLIKGNQLHPFSHEELVNHQWTKSKVQMRRNYIFKRISLQHQV